MNKYNSNANTNGSHSLFLVLHCHHVTRSTHVQNLSLTVSRALHAWHLRGQSLSLPQLYPPLVSLLSDRFPSVRRSATHLVWLLANTYGHEVNSWNFPPEHTHKYIWIDVAQAVPAGLASSGSSRLVDDGFLKVSRSVHCDPFVTLSSRFAAW
jgi:hypothetical protein